jgi:hypothetical protein
MLRTLCLLAVALVAALALAAPASARGGDYVLEGGTPRMHAQVRVALEASRFDWSLVPARIVVHLRAGSATYATPGHIWLDSDLLNSGTFAWGTIQHEYAHQVDFFLLDDAKRASLNAQLGGRVWSNGDKLGFTRSLAHAAAGAERFASTLAWAYWPNPENSLRPRSAKDESAAMAPDRFRQLMERMLGAGGTRA